MGVPPAPRPKICVRCGHDCSNVPRRKNPEGHYCCKACLDNPRRAAAIRQQQAPTPLAPAPKEEVWHDEASSLPLDVPYPDRPPMQECPGCARLIAGDARVCVYCGYSSTEGAPVRPDGVKCRHCGYDLSGLKSPRCPECGKLHVPRRFVGHGAEISREIVRREYLKPALMFLISLPLAFVVYWLRHDVSVALQALLGMVIEIPVALLVYLGCCVIWIGFDAPLHLTVLRIAGILGAVTLTSAVANLLPIYFLPTVITVVVYVGLLSEMLDMDLGDAMIVAVLTYFGAAGVWLWVLWAFLK